MRLLFLFVLYAYSNWYKILTSCGLPFFLHPFYIIVCFLALCFAKNVTHSSILYSRALRKNLWKKIFEMFRWECIPCDYKIVYRVFTIHQCRYLQFVYLYSNYFRFIKTLNVKHCQLFLISFYYNIIFILQYLHKTEIWWII